MAVKLNRISDPLLLFTLVDPITMNHNSIIIPCYNEANRIDLDSFEDFINSRNDYSICFVNDGSSDNTLELLNEFKSKHPNRVHLVNCESNRGKGEALRNGVHYVLNNTSSKNIGFLDADLATGFKDYENLVENLEISGHKKSMVIGSRIRHEEKNIIRNPIRAFLSKLINKVIVLIIGMKINDTQCGAKVFSRESAHFIFSKKFKSRWLFDIEMLMRLRNKIGKKKLASQVNEVSLSKWNDVEGSKISYKDIIIMPIQLINIIITYNFKPILKIQKRDLFNSSLNSARSFLS